MTDLFVETSPEMAKKTKEQFQTSRANFKAAKAQTRAQLEEVRHNKPQEFQDAAACVKAQHEETKAEFQAVKKETGEQMRDAKSAGRAGIRKASEAK